MELHFDNRNFHDFDRRSLILTVNSACSKKFRGLSRDKQFATVIVALCQMFHGFFSLTKNSFRFFVRRAILYNSGFSSCVQLELSDKKCKLSMFPTRAETPIGFDFSDLALNMLNGRSLARRQGNVR